MFASALNEARPSTPQQGGRKPRRVCIPLPRLCPDIPLCTRALAPPELRPNGASGSGFIIMGDDVFEMDVEHAPAVGVHQASDDDDQDPKWDSVDDAMPTLEEAQRAFSQQREFRHQVAAGLGATLQVVPRAVAVTPTRLAASAAATPTAQHTWTSDKPALGLMLDSEAVIRQMQQTQGGAGGHARGWMSPPQQPEAMPPSIRGIMKLEPLQSDMASSDLVGDLFGAQAQAAFFDGSFLNGHAYAPNPSTPTVLSTGAATCANDFDEGSAYECIDPHVAKGFILNGKGHAVVANGGKSFAHVNAAVRQHDDIDMSEV